MIKSNTYLSIKRGKLANNLSKMGLSLADYEVITHPFDYAFDFEKGEGNVNVESAFDVLPKGAQSVFSRFLECYEIKPQTCHETSAIVALVLKKYGVTVCDGYYKHKASGLMYKHKFCKLGNRYFDSTLETVYGFYKTKGYEYFSIREFEPKEIMLYYATYSYALHNKLGGLFYTSTLGDNPYNWRDAESDFYLDNEGFMHPIDKDYALPMAA